MKKAQLEAIGLVIIVILIIVGLLIFLMLSTSPQTDKYTPTLLQIKANNLRNALLKTTLSPDCNVEDEVISCIQTQSPVCLSDCSQVRNMILTSISKTLDEKDGYELLITSSANQSFLKTNRYDFTNCISASSSNLKDDIDFNLKLCRE